jgi:hypothetical protein
MKNKNYYKLWLELKHYIAFKYGFHYKSLETMAALKDVLERMKSLENEANKKDN